MIEMIWTLLGVVTAIGSVGLLYAAWSKRSRSWQLILGGWFLATVSLVSWSQTSGVDKGSAKAIVAFILIVLTVLAVLAYRSPVKQRRNIEREPAQAIEVRSGLKIWAMRSYNFILLLLVSGLAAMSISTAAFMVGRAVGAEHTANLTVSMFLFPILWAIFSVVTGYASRPLVKSAVLCVLAVVPALLIPALQ
jgi:CDP-diglyceride synthetase